MSPERAWADIERIEVDEKLVSECSRLAKDFLIRRARGGFSEIASVSAPIFPRPGEAEVWFTVIDGEGFVRLHRSGSRWIGKGERGLCLRAGE